MVEPEVELLTGEAVAVLFDVGPGDDGHLLPGDGAGCRTDRQEQKTEPIGEDDDGEGRSAEPKLFLPSWQSWNHQRGVFLAAAAVL